ncbi:hypothetical protein BJ878DRAFT_581105 [Calycina marina]|uniref:Uncharacterized protein n=1 Tax=Calycina marina TaxID=1763456 RepID=A0A9P7Z7I2_9HELO|nr:hypothetical protein BJ878DRAFT_581105 [Calycina marina]
MSAPSFLLDGRAAVVSGASSGLGLCTAHALAEAGAYVAITYLSSQSADEDAAETEHISWDVTRAQDVDVVIHQVLRDFNGRLDLFVANCGIAWNETGVLDSSISHYREIMSTNLGGFYHCARAAGQHFRRQARDQVTVYGAPLLDFWKRSFMATAIKSGHTVNFPHIQTAYNASKAGVIYMCKSLAVEWVDFARVNTISPGFIESGLTAAVPDVKDTLREKTPFHRIGDLKELTGAYLYLALDASTFTTGTDLIIDGGYTLW